jgi:hypothetical protein
VPYKLRDSEITGFDDSCDSLGANLYDIAKGYQ